MAELQDVNRRSEGVSLVELLIVILISSILGAGVVAVVTSTMRAQLQVRDMSENLDAARRGVERIRDVAREAYGICDDSESTTVRFWVPQLEDDSERRIDEEEIITFAIDGDQLTRADGTGSAATILRGVAGTSFVFFDNDDISLLDATGEPTAEIGLDCQSEQTVEEGDSRIVSIGMAVSGDRGVSGRAEAVALDNRVTLRNAIRRDGAVRTNRAPIASFFASCSPPACEFRSLGSYDEDGFITTFLWDFGDGASAVGETTTHVFTLPVGPDPAPYLVGLTVVDNLGATGTKTLPISIGTDDPRPAAFFTYTCTTDLLCTFDGSDSFRYLGNISRYAWSFGDGNSIADGGVLENHQFSDSGIYTAVLTVTDSDGFTDSLAREISVSDQPDFVIVSLFDVSQGIESSENWLARVQVSVRFGDGTPAEGRNVTASFGGTELTPAATNSAGTVTLQDDGSYGPTDEVLVTIVDIEGVDFTPASITLRQP